MTTNMDALFWMTNEDWYTFDENDNFILTDIAPEKAIKSFELYKNRD